MCVLDIVDGVLVALRLGEIEVEIEVLVAFSQHVEETRRVVADLVPQLAQRNELAGAGGHGDLLAAAVEHGELHQRDGELLRMEAQRCERALDARYVAVMIGPPHVDHELEAVLEFVLVVGDVRGEISVLPVLALDHAVLLVAEAGRAEPAGAAFRENAAFVLEHFDDALDLPRVV
ncbi:hypothetical protein D3C83_00200 [compost metagenome]